MSIKQKYLERLVIDFVNNSDIKKSSDSRIEEIKEEIKKIILEDSIKNIDPDDLESLKVQKNFWIVSELRLGEYFKTSHETNGSRIGYYDGVGVTLRDLSIPSSYSDYYMSNIPEETVKKISPLNDELIDILKKIGGITSSFNRLINTRTSKKWLKSNFPEVYDKLRKYEEGVIPV